MERRGGGISLWHPRMTLLVLQNWELNIPDGESYLREEPKQKTAQHRRRQGLELRREGGEDCEIRPRTEVQVIPQPVLSDAFNSYLRVLRVCEPSVTGADLQNHSDPICRMNYELGVQEGRRGARRDDYHGGSVGMARTRAWGEGKSPERCPRSGHPISGEQSLSRTQCH